MKKICSLLLSVAIIATMVFCPTVGIFASAETTVSTTSSVCIENTFDEADWNPTPNSNLTKENIDGGNGYSLRFNKITSSSATSGNSIRHYKIFDPQKVDGGYIDFKPSANTTYKLTFSYRTRSLASNNILISVRGVANDTVGDALCRAVTVKKFLSLTTNDDYKWDTAIAYFTTPEDALQALAISVEWDGAADSSGVFNVAIDDVKLETAPSNFVLANTFEEDDVYSFGIDDVNITGTINSGTDKGICITGSNNMNQTGYSTSSFGSANAVTARTNSTLGFRALRELGNSNKVHYEIYDYSQGLGENGKLKSFVPENGSNYRITFDYKVKIGSKNILFTIRPVTTVNGKRTLGNAIATAVYIPTGDSNHSSPTWKTAAFNVPVTQDVEGLALTIETDATSGATTYTYIDNIVVHKLDSDVIINDYEETLLGSGNNAETTAATKITGANLFHLGTKTKATPNTSRVLQFYPIVGTESIASGTFTYVEIYNPYDADFAGFTPKADTYYKVSFDFKTARTPDGDINFNIRGIKDGALGDVIETAATVAKDNTYYGTDTNSYNWGKGSALINTAGKAYDTLAISIEATTSKNQGIYPYIDNIVVEELTSEGETSFNIHHSTGETEKYVTTNLMDLSTIELSKEGYVFKGLYFDTEYRIPASGIAYGVTDVYAKWNDERIIENTYDELGYVNNDTNFDTASSLPIVKVVNEGRTGNALQFMRVYGSARCATLPYTNIYNSNTSDYSFFKPTVGETYVLTLWYKPKNNTRNTTLQLYGVKNADLSDGVKITDICEISKDISIEWYKASVAFTVTEEFNSLAIANNSFRTDGSANAYYTLLDDIKLEKVPEGETRFAVHHNVAIYGKSRDILEKNNFTNLSEITFENTETAKFEGLYFDSEYKNPATGIVYGVTDLYAKWRDLTTFVNSYDKSGITSKNQLVGTDIMNCGKIDAVAPNVSNVVKFNGIGGQNLISQGKITHVELYDPYVDNFATEEKLASYKPLKNSVYKITFEYFTTASKDGDISFNIRGKKDDQFSDILGTAVVIKSGDTNYSSYAWNEAEVYIYTEGTEYDALALTLETSGKYKASVIPYIDNINVEGLKEYKSGVINTVASDTNNKSGLLAINNGKWFELAANEYAKVSFNLETATAIANSSVVARIIGENGKVESVTLFDFSEESGERKYTATFKAPFAGKVAISVHKNDDVAVNQEVVLSGLTIDKYAPSLLKGDTNLDGKINAVDVVALKRATVLEYAVGGYYLTNADLSKDGVINVSDVAAIRNYLISDSFGSQDLGITADYTFANETAGSAEGVITLTSTETTDNFVEIYWGANGEPIDTYYFIGSAEAKAGQSVEVKMASHLAIPEGATQIIVNDGMASKAFDFAKRYDASFEPNRIGLVKDYTVGEKIANVKVVYPYELKSVFNVNKVSETYDLICEFRNKLSDVLGADVELISDINATDANQNYIVIGNTTFDESTTLLNNIKTAREDYNADFAIKAVGKNIYINADNDYALQFAFDYFFNTYCTNGVTSIKNNINYLSSAELKTITLADVDINNYTIVYPETATVLEVDAAEYLAANILKATGKAPMSIVNDATAVSDYEILIGHTNRTNADYATTADATADNSYTITVEANRTVITGGTNSAVNAGVIDLVSRLMAGSLAIGTYEGKYDGSFSLTNGFKLTWSDEFNGNELSTVWQPLSLNYETAADGIVVWDNSNATVENGALKATAGKIAGTNNTTGVSLDTAYNKLAQYGYFEARIKSFDEAGYMNGFWGSTIGRYVDVESGVCHGEFDILEEYDVENQISPNLLNHKGEIHKNYLQGVDATKPSTTVNDMGTKFHNFAMEWTDDYIYFYLDGVKYYSFDCTTLPEYDVFDAVTRIRLTFSAGKYTTPTADSDEAFVDWVRVWQKDEAGYIMK